MARTRARGPVTWGTKSPEYMDLVRNNLGLPPRGRPRGSVTPRRSFLKRHKTVGLGLAVAGGAASVHYIDGFRLYPMADKVPPPAIAFGGLLVASLAVNQFSKRRDVAELLAALAVGVAFGGIGKAIATRQAGGK